MTQAPPSEVRDEALSNLQRRLQPGTSAVQPPLRNHRIAANSVDAVKRLARRVIRRSIAWYVDQTVERVAERTRYEVSEALNADGASPAALAVNLELLKGELRGMQAVLEDIGSAVAPTAGLEGARHRLAELRQRVNELDRRMRKQSRTNSHQLAVLDSSDVPAADAEAAPFDYVGFERRFRGESDAIRDTLVERYLDVLRGQGPVLDLGCGRGEFVGALSDAGIQASGVDLDADSVEEARAHGRDVRLGDALTALRETPEHSLGAIVSFQVLEHLGFDSVVALIELAASRLRPGGVFIAETPNPGSLIVLGTSYVLDPTHVKPLHPALAAFLCERAGFRDIDLRFFAPAEQFQLPRIEGPALPPWVADINKAFHTLNNVLFGPQDYAVVARTVAE